MALRRLVRGLAEAPRAQARVRVPTARHGAGIAARSFWRRQRVLGSTPRSHGKVFHKAGYVRSGTTLEDPLFRVAQEVENGLAPRRCPSWCRSLSDEENLIVKLSSQSSAFVL